AARRSHGYRHRSAGSSRRASCQVRPRPHKGFSVAERIVTLLYATELLGQCTAGCVALRVNRAKVDDTKTVWRFEDLGVPTGVPTYQDHALRGSRASACSK